MRVGGMAVTIELLLVLKDVIRAWNVYNNLMFV